MICTFCRRPIEHGTPQAAGYGCDKCMAALRDSVIAREIGVGVGVQIGPLREDWGDGFADLRCNVDACGATWVGHPGEVCGYCAVWLELCTDTQRIVLLRPDLPTDDDNRRHRAMLQWVDRIAAAVKAEILTEHEARAAVRREEGRRVA